MSSDKKVSFPNDLLEKMTIETTIFTPENEKLGVAILTEMESSTYILRIYQLILSPDGKQYNVVQELAAFRYKKRHEVDDFIERLPNMSGIEMLMMLNPTKPFPSLMN